MKQKDLVKVFPYDRNSHSITPDSFNDDDKVKTGRVNTWGTLYLSSPGVIDFSADTYGASNKRLFYSDQNGYDIVDMKLIVQPRQLGIYSVNKEYDGTSGATLTVDNLYNVIRNDKNSLSISGVTASYTGENAADAGTGKTVDYSGLTLTGDAAGNYTIAASGTSTGNSITKKQLSATFNTISKVYDGGTVGIPNITLTGVVGTDDVSATATATYEDKNAGTEKRVDYSGIGLTGEKAANYVLDAASAADQSVAGNTITKKELKLVADKVYDGTANVEAGDIALATDIIEGDYAVFDNSKVTGVYEDENVNVSGSKSVTYTANTGALTGTDAGNYSIATAGTGDITPRTVTLDGTISKVYDATDEATPTVDALSNVIEADKTALNISATSATFSDVNVGDELTVTYEGLQLGGTKAGNYLLSDTGATVLNNSITQRPVTLTGTISKVYDGTTAAIPSAGSLSDVIGEDLEDLDLLATSASFDNKNVGENNRTITYEGLTLSGEKAPNYRLTSTSATINGNSIIPKELALVADKVRIKKGGTPPTTFTGNLTGFVPGENLPDTDRSKLLFTASISDTTTAGSYPITGTFNGDDHGNYGENYTFKNAISNATAFTIFTDMMPKLDLRGGDIKAASPYVTIDDTTANTMVISSTQDNNVLKWIDFSIDSGGTVKYDAKNYLNFVTGHGRSEIYGTLAGEGTFISLTPTVFCSALTHR